MSRPPFGLCAAVTFDAQVSTVILLSCIKLLRCIEADCLPVKLAEAFNLLVEAFDMLIGVSKCSSIVFLKF